MSARPRETKQTQEKHKGRGANENAEWCVTSFYPNECRVYRVSSDGLFSPADFVFPEDIKFFVAQIETCPTTGRKHVQAYVEYMTPRKFELAKDARLWGDAAGKVHVTEARGTREENVRYCHKDGDGTHMPDVQTRVLFCRVGTVDETGKKRDMRERKRKRDGGETETKEQKKMQIRLDVFDRIEEILGKCGACLQTAFTLALNRAKEEEDEEKKEVWIKAATTLRQNSRFYEARLLTKQVGDPRVVNLRHVTVEVMIGKTGVGKTHRTYKNYGSNVYAKETKHKWWDGYTNQPVLFLDEFRGDPENSGGYFTTSTMQKIMQGFPMFMEVKGTTAKLQAAWTHVVIASNIEIAEWFECWKHVPPEVKKSIEDRMTDVVHLEGESLRKAMPKRAFPVIEGVKFVYSE